MQEQWNASSHAGNSPGHDRRDAVIQPNRKQAKPKVRKEYGTHTSSVRTSTPRSGRRSTERLAPRVRIAAPTTPKSGTPESVTSGRTRTAPYLRSPHSKAAPE